MYTISAIVVYTCIHQFFVDWLDGWLADCLSTSVFCQAVPALTAFQARKSQSVAVVSNKKLRTYNLYLGKTYKTRHQNIYNGIQPSQSSSTSKFHCQTCSFYWVEPVDVDNSSTWKMEEGTVDDQSESKAKRVKNS